jgi:hypothetical protein
MRAQASSLRPSPIFTLSRARICEGVAPHSLLARHFCRTAGAIILGLLLGLTRRQSFRLGHMSLRPGHTNRHGSCKQRHSERFQHGCFLPGSVTETLSSSEAGAKALGLVSDVRNAAASAGTVIEPPASSTAGPFLLRYAETSVRFFG